MAVDEVRADVVILGGGLAGLTLVLQLRQRFPDLEVLVVERRRHPVPAAAHKVGESSVEIAANYFDTVLGLKEHLVGELLKKFGFRFFFSEGRRDIDSVLAELEFAGYDHIVVGGKAEQPVYLLIEDDKVLFKPAAVLWRKTTAETEQIIKKETGKDDLQVLCIGPAGEKLSRQACIVVSGSRVAVADEADRDGPSPASPPESPRRREPSGAVNGSP